MILNNKLDAYNYLFLWVLFTATAPFYFHLAIPFHPYKWLVFLGLLFMVVRLFKNKSFNIGNRQIVVILLIQMTYSLAAALLHETFLGVDLIYINLALQLLAVLIVYTYINTFFNVDKVAISVLYVIAVIGVLGGGAFALGIAGILKPVNTFPPDTNLYTNFVLTFSNTYYEIGNVVFMRTAGFFDEPGAFAYFITMSLLVNKLYGYSKKIELLLIFVGFITFSLAFYISMFLYFIVFYFRRRNAVLVIFVVTLVALLVLLVDRFKDENEIVNVVYELTIKRFTPAKDKIIEGNNRAQKYIWSKEAFVKSPLIGHGISAYSNPDSEFHGKLCCNILDPLATHGVLGTFIFYLLFMYWFLIIITHSKLDLVALGAFLIVVANFFQRPGFHGGLFGYFIYIFLVEATIWRQRNKTILLKDTNE